MRIPSALAAAALVASPVVASAQAQQAVRITSQVQAVKEVTDAQGRKTRTLVEPTTVIPGTPLVIWVRYANSGRAPANNFVINNPVNPSIDFTAFGENSGWGLVSVDGGKTFGALATLKVARADKTLRAALPADVTHVRWTFPRAIAPGASGTLSFYAVVK
jgi:hypothetical protein